MKLNRHGQVTAELAVLLTFVIAAFVFLGFYLQRATQGGVRSNADSLGQQFSSISAWSTFSAQDSHETAGRTATGSCSDYSHVVGVDLNADGIIDTAPALVEVGDCVPVDGAGL